MRRSRDRARKTSSSSPSKAKPLHILPQLMELSEQEEEETHASASSSSSHLSPAFRPWSAKSSPDASTKKRNSRRVVLTGAEGLTLDDFFPIQTPRPAPSPPNARPYDTQLESPLDSISLRFSPLSLPYSNVPTSPGSSRSARSPSPTPSVASTASASTVSSVSSACAKVLTPPTSDDESHESPTSRLARAPTFKSHRGTIGYVPGAARKHRSASEKSFVDLQLAQEESYVCPDDASWFAQDISDAFIMSPNAEFGSMAALPKTPVASTSRGTGRSRFSKPLPSVPRFSVQVCT